MKRKKYIYTNRTTSELAVMSVALGLISLVSVIIVLYLTYLNGGEAPLSYGLTGLFAVLFSLIGLILGILKVQEKETFKLFPVLGILINGAALVVMAFLVRLGM